MAIRLARTEGIALIMTLMASVVLLTVVGVLVPLASTEVMIAANHRRAVEGLYAAEAALEWTVGELAPSAAWGAALAGGARSGVWAGALELLLADGSRVLLDEQTAALSRDGAGPSGAGRGLAWSLFAHGRLARLIPLPTDTASGTSPSGWPAGQPPRTRPARMPTAPSPCMPPRSTPGGDSVPYRPTWSASFRRCRPRERLRNTCNCSPGASCADHRGRWRPAAPRAGPGPLGAGSGAHADSPQGALEVALRYVIDDFRAAEAGGEDNVQGAAEHLLVAARGLHYVRGGEVAHGGQRAEAGDQRGQRSAIRVVEDTAPDGDVGHGQHPVAHRFAVTEAAVLRHRLDRVPGGVAEIQQAPQAALPLVLRDDVGLDAARRRDDGDERVGLAGEDGVEVPVDPVEQVPVRDDAVLDDLVQASPELAARQRPQHQGVGDDGNRLMERSDEVLAERMVTPTLPPMAASTCASRVVGTWTRATPRRMVAAAKPAMSPMTPPPTAMTVAERSAEARRSSS